MPQVNFENLRLNLEAVLTEKYEHVKFNTILTTCTVTQDSTLASDHPYWVANHPIHCINQFRMHV